MSLEETGHHQLEKKTCRRQLKYKLSLEWSCKLTKQPVNVVNLKLCLCLMAYLAWQKLSAKIKCTSVLKRQVTLSWTCSYIKKLFDTYH